MPSVGDFQRGQILLCRGYLAISGHVLLWLGLTAFTDATEIQNLQKSPTTKDHPILSLSSAKLEKLSEPVII